MATQITSEKQDEILACARKRMLHYGIQKTTMQEIARDCGIAVGTLYLYFRNKEEIVLAIARQYQEQHAGAAEGILASNLPVEEKFRRFLLEKFHFIADFTESNAHSKEFSALLLELEPECTRQWHDRNVACITRILNDGIKQKVFNVTDPDREAKAAIYAFKCFFPCPHLTPPDRPGPEALNFMVDWFIERWTSGV